MCLMGLFFSSVQLSFDLRWHNVGLCLHARRIESYGRVSCSELSSSLTVASGLMTFSKDIVGILGSFRQTNDTWARQNRTVYTGEERRGV
jgi:hypothetical protein